MPITTHVTNLELSRRLKELKVPQKSLFRWDESDGVEDRLEYLPEFSNKTHELTSAYLASELGELLPNVIKKSVEDSGSDTLEDWHLSYNPDGEVHKVIYTYYYYEPMDYVTFSGITEAEARAKCLIHLLENHLISVEELGK